MKTVLLLAALMVLVACQGEVSVPAEPVAVQGCLTSTNGTYQITDDFGHRYDLSGDTSQLKQNVGHEMLIHGSVMQLKATPQAPSGTVATANSRLTVTNASLVKDSCSARR